MIQRKIKLWHLKSSLPLLSGPGVVLQSRFVWPRLDYHNITHWSTIQCYWPHIHVHTNILPTVNNKDLKIQNKSASSPSGTEERDSELKLQISLATVFRIWLNIQFYVTFQLHFLKFDTKARQIINWYYGVQFVFKNDNEVKCWAWNIKNVTI